MASPTSSKGAIALARITSEDPFAGLPEPEAFGKLDGDLHLYFDDVNHMPPAERIEIARRAEAAALAYDTRIQNSRGGDFDTATSHKIMLNSRGFFGEYRRSYCGFSASPIAQDEKGNMQRDYWFSNARTTTRTPTTPKLSATKPHAAPSAASTPAASPRRKPPSSSPPS